MNKVAFYYRKDLNVTKHGEYKAGSDMKMGDPVRRDDATGTLVLAQNSDEFEGIVDAVRWNVQGGDTLDIKKDEICRVGVGVDYEFVVKGGSSDFSSINENTEVGVNAGKFVIVDGTTVTKAVGKVIKKFDSGEVVVRIY